MSPWNEDDERFMRRFERNLALEPVPEWALSPRPFWRREWPPLLGAALALLSVLFWGAPWLAWVSERVSAWSYDQLGVAPELLLGAGVFLATLGWLAYDGEFGNGSEPFL